MWHFDKCRLRQSDFAILRGFRFHETSPMRIYGKIKPSRKFPNLQYKKLWFTINDSLVQCVLFFRDRHAMKTSLGLGLHYPNWHIKTFVCSFYCSCRGIKWLLQLKTLIKLDEFGSKIARNSVFDCHLSPVGRQMAIKISVSNYFYSSYVDSINIFDCSLSGVRIKSRLAYPQHVMFGYF